MSFRDEGATVAGVATYADDGRVLDAWFPSPSLGDSADVAAVDLPAGPDALRGVSTGPVVVRIPSLSSPPVDALDVYLRLHLLSHRLIRPHEACLDGVFGLLTNVAWTS